MIDSLQSRSAAEGDPDRPTGEYITGRLAKAVATKGLCARGLTQVVPELVEVLRPEYQYPKAKLIARAKLAEKDIVEAIERLATRYHPKEDDEALRAAKLLALRILFGIDTDYRWNDAATRREASGQALALSPRAMQVWQCRYVDDLYWALDDLGMIRKLDGEHSDVREVQ